VKEEEGKATEKVSNFIFRKGGREKKKKLITGRIHIISIIMKREEKKEGGRGGFKVI